MQLIMCYSKYIITFVGQYLHLMEKWVQAKLHS